MKFDDFSSILHQSRYRKREDVLAAMARPALLQQLPFLAYFAWHTFLRWVTAWSAGRGV